MFRARAARATARPRSASSRAERETGGDPHLKTGQTGLLQPAKFGDEERMIRKLRVWRSAPRRKRLPEVTVGRLRVSVVHRLTGTMNEVRECVGVDCGWVNRKPVPPSDGQDVRAGIAIRLERRPNPSHQHLDTLDRTARGNIVPEHVGQKVDGHDLAEARDENRQESPLLWTTQSKHVAVTLHLQGPEHAQLHEAIVACSYVRPDHLSVYVRHAVGPRGNGVQALSLASRSCRSYIATRNCSPNRYISAATLRGVLR